MIQNYVDISLCILFLKSKMTIKIMKITITIKIKMSSDVKITRQISLRWTI